IIAINILLFWTLPILSQNDIPEKESFILLAGNGTTADGSVLVANNKGLKRGEGSFIQKNSGQKHDSTGVIRFQNGLEIPQARTTMAWMGLHTKNGVQQGDAVAINEHQVSIAGSVSLESDRNRKAREADPLIPGGVIGSVYYKALERARTAKECVNLIGKYYNRYGIAQAYGLAIADKNEIWYMEAGGGHHWAAIKIPQDAVWIQANEYRIGHVDPDDGDVMASPGLLEFARNNGLWDPDEQLFDFAEAFGQRTQKMEDKEQFNHLKIWRAIHLLDSTSGVTPDQKTYPQFIRPREKVGLPKLISILRDHPQSSSYDSLYHDSLERHIRPIASKQVVHTSIVQLTDGLPATVGAVLWSGFSAPLTTPYIPFYFGIQNVPKPYNNKTREEERAFRAYKTLAELFYQDPVKYEKQFPQIWSDFQTKCFNEQVHIDRGAMRLYRMDSARPKQFLTTNVEGLGLEALDIARKTLNRIR
ncbi:MAG: C69 family dipeptidase, partial [Bacteroidales bacterium]|nr:C69 family dipeptidase [Bacteroidales bacterium]